MPTATQVLGFLTLSVKKKKGRARIILLFNLPHCLLELEKDCECLSTKI